MKKQIEIGGAPPPQKPEHSSGDLSPKTIAYWVCRDCQYHDYVAFSTCPNCGGRHITKRKVEFTQA